MRSTSEIKTEEESKKKTSEAKSSPYGFFEEEDIVTKLYEQNRVIINIWASAKNHAIPGANVGHAAIMTPHDYISLWPGPSERKHTHNKVEEAFQQSWGKYFTLRPSSWKASYLEDCVLEAYSEGHYRQITHSRNRHVHEEIIALVPDGDIQLLQRDEPTPKDALLLAVTPLHANVRIALYELKIEAIHTAFDEIKKSCPGWRLTGSNFLTRLATGSGESCASVAYRMLCAGGMYKKMLRIKGSSDTSSVTTPDKLIRHVMAAKEKEIAKYTETKKLTFTGESNLLELQDKYSDKPTRMTESPEARSRIKSRL